MAVGGGTAVVGAYLDDPACPASPSCNSGAAHVFELGPAGWVAAGTLVPADAAAYDQFGHSVSISGDRIAVGSHQDGDAGTSSGAAYVFARSGSQWLEEAKLVAPDGAAQDQLGRAVAIAGERVLAGAPFDDDAGEGSGAAYVFELAPQGWVPTAKLTAPGAAAGDWFGYAVALDGDRAVVGAPQPYNGGRGAAYVFDFDGLAWQPRAVLAADDGQPGDRFGDAVAVYGAVVVAGAPSHDGGATGSGAAYVYEPGPGGWTQRAELGASPPEPQAGFGNAVAAWGERVLAGARYQDGAATNEGAVHVFERAGGGWPQVEELTAANPLKSDQLGTSVALEGDRVLAGALTDGSGYNSGSAYSFRYPCALLTGSPDQLSVGSGGVQTFGLAVDGAHALLPYLLLGSLSGTEPGFPISGLVLPLNADAYTLITLLQPGAPPLAGSLGTLDASGQATASFTLPPGLPPTLAGQVLNHAFVVIEATPTLLAVVLASNPVALTLVP